MGRMESDGGTSFSGPRENMHILFWESKEGPTNV